MGVENMDVFVERIRTILAAIHLRATFLSAGMPRKLGTKLGAFFIFSARVGSAIRRALTDKTQQSSP
jgi:hypothetical protein